MICYKDMSFCDDAKRCSNRENCQRYFSPIEQNNSIKWWGNENAPVCFAKFADTCKDFKESINI